MWTKKFQRAVPTLLAVYEQAGAALAEHASHKLGTQRWLMTGLRAGLLWAPICLLAMLAGAALVAPLKLVSGGLALGDTEKGRWLLRQSWPWLVGKTAVRETLLQLTVLGAYWGVRRALRPLHAGAAVTLAFLIALLLYGLPAREAAPLAAIQGALVLAFARSGSLLPPVVSGLVLALSSLYSARLIVLLSADLGSPDAMPGIPAGWGVLCVFLAYLAGLAVLGLAQPLRREPRRGGLLYGPAVYLSGYLTYYAVYALIPAHETVPPVLKQTLLMPLDLLIFVFVIGAALEEVIFRRGLFQALIPKLGVWPAAWLSAIVFSGFHFIDWSFLPQLLGVSVSRLVQSMLVVYGFSWAGFAGRVGAGLMLAWLYRSSGGLAVPIAAHFASNFLEAIGLRFGLPWMLACVAALLSTSCLRGAGRGCESPARGGERR